MKTVQRNRIFEWFACGAIIVLVTLSNYASLLGTLSSYNIGGLPETKYLTDVILTEESLVSQTRRSQWILTLQNANQSVLGVRVFSPRIAIDRIHLIGERHSGTTYFTKLLKECFPNIQVSDVFVNGKHWMQPSPEDVRRVVTMIGSKDVAQELDLLSWWNLRERDDIEKSFQSSMVIALFRDPYQWVEAMRRKPHHWPNHLVFRPIQGNYSVVDIPQPVYDARKDLRSSTTQRKKDSSGTTASGLRIPAESTTFGGKVMGGGSIQKSFVEHELLNWTAFVGENLYLDGYHEDNRDSVVCQKGYTYISPCHRNMTYVPYDIQKIPRAFLRHLFASANDPVYELTKEGKPFGHILQLRAAKIQNVFQIPVEWNLAAFAAFPYERLLHDVAGLLGEIGKVTNQTANCAVPKSSNKAPYILPDPFQVWIGKNADWGVERLIGYDQGH
ncbi:hypothetical protein IV203_029219 [Nitzschia inconspicua]|uniref:Sulfotransferase n=1 Tax=Nitzschia inconspicua TaxID=303405 RepID=A0A9K3LRE5_9STRA|nr:hypothetical protein IV203_029219 [Nitzschia inconspicua]